jgi:hypothetical protein
MKSSSRDSPATRSSENARNSPATASAPTTAACLSWNRSGEVEVRDEDVGGIGVHIASRALGEAGDGQVVVTRTLRELATGTDLVFEPLGAVALRGVPGEWELFEASIA